MENRPTRGSGFTAPPKRSFMLRFALELQNFLLRRNWMGSAGDYIMVITTTGRVTGRPFSVPISYLRSGDRIYALNQRGISNWYRNVRAKGRAVLEIKGKKTGVSAELITDPAESRAILERFRAAPQLFQRLMGIPADSDEDVLLGVLDRVRFVCFTPEEPPQPG